MPTGIVRKIDDLGRVVIPAEPKTYEIFAVIGGTMKKVQIEYPAQRTVDLK